MKTKLIAVLALVLTTLSGFALADTPSALAGPHGHGQEVSGKITLLRAQQQNLEIGSGPNFLDAEVLVTLDTQPGKVFGVRVHGDDTGAASREIVETLRDAYLNKIPVTIQHRIAPNSNHLKIIWVQLGDLPSWAAAK